MKKYLAISTTAIVLLVGILAIVVAPYFLEPKFVVANESSNDVYVSAHWRDKERDIGIIQSGSKYTFSVSDEAAMRFVVRYDDGSVVESDEIYFTSGSVVYAKITDTAVKIDYDFNI